MSVMSPSLPANRRVSRLIVVDDHGENQIAVGAGANAAITADHISRCLGASLPAAGCVLGQH